jgi:hypothetical protein
LIHEWNLPAAGDLALAPWQIPVCATDPVGTLAILQRLPGDADLTPDLRRWGDANSPYQATLEQRPRRYADRTYLS